MMKVGGLPILLVVTLSITANSANPTLGKAHIPFACNVNGQTLEAGDYEVRSIGAGVFCIQHSCPPRASATAPAST